MAEPLTPIEQTTRSMAARVVVVLVMVVYILGLFLFRRFNPNFPVVYTPIEDGWIMATAPELPGAVTQGDDWATTISNAGGPSAPCTN